MTHSNETRQLFRTYAAQVAHKAITEADVIDHVIQLAFCDLEDAQDYDELLDYLDTEEAIWEADHVLAGAQ